MYNHNKAQQSKNRVHISWDILYILILTLSISTWDHALRPANQALGWRVVVVQYSSILPFSFKINSSTNFAHINCSHIVCLHILVIFQCGFDMEYLFLIDIRNENLHRKFYSSRCRFCTRHLKHNLLKYNVSCWSLISQNESPLRYDCNNMQRS